MSRFAKITVVFLSLLVFLYVGLGYLMGKTDDDKTYRSLSVYGEVLQRVQEDYVDEPNLSVVTAGALHGLLESLDPYSGYLSQREYTDYKEKLKNPPRGELGAAVSKRFGYIVVVSVLPDGPAAKAGLRSGDLLEAISGFTSRDMSVGQAEALLNGAPGTSVKLAVVRRGSTEPQPMEIQRGELPMSHVTAEKIEDDVAYIRLPALDAPEVVELHDKLQQFERQGLRRLVLDLRDCATGPDSEGVAAAQLFVTSGTIGSLGGQTVSRQEFAAAPEKVVWRGPVEVLIADSTSGASEILAAALGGNQRGDLVGTRTFGSASEQKVVPLEDGSALVLTVAFYYTPAGKVIIVDAVPPTVEVLPAVSEVAPGAVAPAPLSLNQLPSKDDPVFHKALDLIQKNGSRKAA